MEEGESQEKNGYQLPKGGSPMLLGKRVHQRPSLLCPEQLTTKKISSYLPSLYSFSRRGMHAKVSCFKFISTFLEIPPPSVSP